MTEYVDIDLTDPVIVPPVIACPAIDEISLSLKKKVADAVFVFVVPRASPATKTPVFPPQTGAVTIPAAPAPLYAYIVWYTPLFIPALGVIIVPAVVFVLASKIVGLVILKLRFQHEHH